MPVLEIKDLKKSFGDKEVLRGLSLSVPEHSVFGFIGRNGAGKTTTMKAALGLLRPDGGEIYVAGEKVSFGGAKTNRYIGYLPDVPEFYGFMTAREYLALCGESLGMSKAEIKERSEELLSLVGLAGEKHRVRGYSRGMKQRLGIAQALFARPKLLICDEPTSALDPVGRKEILDVLLAAREQTTVLFSTHILSDAERICTDIAFLNGGKIAMQGTVAELKKLHSGERFTLELESGGHIPEIISRFPSAKADGAETLSFSGGEGEMHALLAFIAENKIPFTRIERAEPTLEALFMEVAAK
jgi:ABC-2 type transport system ATP-binding protein